MFAGQLKFFTLKHKWRKAEKQAEDIVKDGEEKRITLWQNGGTGDPSDLQQLCLDLACTMKATKDKKEQEQQEAKDEDHNAKERQDAAMETVAKQCGYRDALDANDKQRRQRVRERKQGAMGVGLQRGSSTEQLVS